MKVKKILLTLFILIPGIFAINGCKDDHIAGSDPLNIDYNALYAVNGESNNISIIDISNNQVKATVGIGGAGHGLSDDPEDSLMWPHHVNMNQSKNRLVVGVPGFDLSGGHGGHGSNGHGKVAIVDPADGMSVHIIHLRHPNHNAIYSPNGSEIWTALMDMEGKVFVFNAATYQLKDSVAVGEMPTEITFSADGSMAFVCNNMSNNVTVIDPINKTVMTTISVGLNPVGAWTGSNNKMYVDNEMSQTVSVIDVATMLVEETLVLGFTPGYVAYNQQMNELWITNTTNGNVEYFHRLNNEWHPNGNISTGAGAHAIVFSRDGLKAYVTNQLGRTVSVIDVTTRTKTTDISVGTKPNGMLLRYIN